MFQSATITYFTGSWHSADLSYLVHASFKEQYTTQYQVFHQERKLHFILTALKTMPFVFMELNTPQYCRKNKSNYIIAPTTIKGQQATHLRLKVTTSVSGVTHQHVKQMFCFSLVCIERADVFISFHPQKVLPNRQRICTAHMYHSEATALNTYLTLSVRLQHLRDIHPHIGCTLVRAHTLKALSHTFRIRFISHTLAKILLS